MRPRGKAPERSVTSAETEPLFRKKNEIYKPLGGSNFCRNTFTRRPAAGSA